MKMASISIIIGAMLAVPSAAEAAIIYDNFGPFNQPGPAPGSSLIGRNICGSSASFCNYNDPAYSFIPTSSGMLNQIDIGLLFRSDSEVRLQLTTVAFDPSVSGTGQAPGSVLGSWILTESMGNIASITDISGINLTQGVEYFLHAIPLTASTNVLWFDNYQMVQSRLYQCSGVGCDNHVSFASATQGAIRLTSEDVSSAVPEPATWAMMLIGFGAIGFSMRRRSSSLGFLRRTA